jgi:hypothetical protein
MTWFVLSPSNEKAVTLRARSCMQSQRPSRLSGGVGAATRARCEKRKTDLAAGDVAGVGYGRGFYSLVPALFQSMMLTRFQWFFLS